MCEFERVRAWEQLHHIIRRKRRSTDTAAFAAWRANAFTEARRLARQESTVENEALKKLYCILTIKKEVATEP